MFLEFEKKNSVTLHNADPPQTRAVISFIQEAHPGRIIIPRATPKTQKTQLAVRAGQGGGRGRCGRV